MRFDHIFDRLRIAEDKKNTTYKFLAAILHLGNIEFESKGSDNGTDVVGSTKHHVEVAARLLEISTEELNNHLLYHLIQVSGSKIT